MTGRPLRASLLTSGLLVAGGFLTVGLGWRVVARTLDVSDQLAGLVSGALGGLALIIVGCAHAVIQVGRWTEDTARLDTDRLIDIVAELHALPATGAEPPKPARRRAKR